MLVRVLRLGPAQVLPSDQVDGVGIVAPSEHLHDLGLDASTLLVG